MLIIKRAEKTETIIELFQSFLSQHSQQIGIFDEKEGIVLSHSLTTVDLFNVVLGAKEPENVLNVASMLADAKSHEEPFLWLAHESNIHLAQYLKNQGLSHKGLLTGCFYNLTGSIAGFDKHPAVSMVEVTTDELFYEWCHLFATCHGLEMETVEAYFKASFHDESHLQLFISQVYQKSIGCCAMYTQDKLGLLLWDAVLPVYRRQGVGSMMVISRMELAKEAGCEGVYAFGMHAMLEMLKGIGFKAFGRFNIHRYDPQSIGVEESDG